MDFPNFAHLERIKQKGFLVCSYAENMHPDPTMYKYSWWVFHGQSPIEGSEYLHAEYSLSTSEAMTLVHELNQAGKPCILYNKKKPRRGSKLDAIANHDHPRWKGREWAVAFDQDEDPAWNGHK